MVKKKKIDSQSIGLNALSGCNKFIKLYYAQAILNAPTSQFAFGIYLMSKVNNCLIDTHFSFFSWFSFNGHLFLRVRTMLYHWKLLLIFASLKIASHASNAMLFIPKSTTAPEIINVSSNFAVLKHFPHATPWSQRDWETHSFLWIFF